MDWHGFVQGGIDDDYHGNIGVTMDDEPISLERIYYAADNNLDLQMFRRDGVERPVHEEDYNFRETAWLYHRIKMWRDNNNTCRCRDCVLGRECQAVVDVGNNYI